MKKDKENLPFLFVTIKQHSWHKWKILNDVRLYLYSDNLLTWKYQSRKLLQSEVFFEIRKVQDQSNNQVSGYFLFLLCNQKIVFLDLVRFAYTRIELNTAVDRAFLKYSYRK